MHAAPTNPNDRPLGGNLRNIHQRVGWYTCANLACLQPVGRDHVTLTTTTQLRRFCNTYCLREGLDAWERFRAASNIHQLDMFDTAEQLDLFDDQPHKEQ